MYKFITQDNKYENYEFVETKCFEKIDLSFIQPKEMKLFSNDVFNYNQETKHIDIIHSNFKSSFYNAGILDLKVTYGKYKNKFLYLCKPDDKRIPFFLIPYEKHYSFDKSVQKIYITFQFKHWDNTHPFGFITQNLGRVDDLNCFYEYILYCKSLNISIQQFTKDAKQKLRQQTYQQIIQQITDKYNIPFINKKDAYIFTIDSKKSNDFDDAISYNYKQNKITIYISNVAIIMEYLDLWDAFTNRISTIYLPDKKRSMLPTILSDCLCSLKEKQHKLCYALDLFYNDNNEIINKQLYICNAYISKNYAYENPEEYMENKYFKKIVEILKIKRSKDIIADLMLMFNHYVAQEFSKHKTGIFKSLFQEELDKTIPTNLPNNIYKHLCILKNTASNYCLYDKNNYKSAMHKNIEVYLQITSPIRRLVDLLNNIALLQYLNLNVISEKGLNFYKKWITQEKLDYINISSRTIRKIQSKCYIYHLYQENKRQNKLQHYSGYIFDKIKKEGDGKYQYMVYLPDINITTYINLLENLDNYTKHLFSLFVFINEENDKKKIKLQLCYEK